LIPKASAGKRSPPAAESLEVSVSDVQSSMSIDYKHSNVSV
jgi:hypothetical protein